MTEIGAFSSTGGREEEAGHDAGPEGEAVRWRQEGRRQEDRRRRECLLDICLTDKKQQFFRAWVTCRMREGR